MIKFININLFFNGKQIFRDFSLSAEKGSKTAIKGRSGIGKTTLFNMLMGFVKPDKGQIFFDDALLNEANIAFTRKRISWLPQNPAIIGRGKIREQIMLPFYFSYNKHLLPDEKKLSYELGKLNLEHNILDKSFDEISGGEKQRLGIMICNMLKREAMLLDEPTSALDKENLKAVIDYLCSEDGLTILSASHDEDWLSHCDNVIEI